jgi:hypothetical protein
MMTESDPAALFAGELRVRLDPLIPDGFELVDEGATLSVRSKANNWSVTCALGVFFEAPSTQAEGIQSYPV